jgi:hypothetical protein
VARPRSTARRQAAPPVARPLHRAEAGGTAGGTAAPPRGRRWRRRRHGRSAARRQAAPPVARHAPLRGGGRHRRWHGTPHCAEAGNAGGAARSTVRRLAAPPGCAARPTRTRRALAPRYARWHGRNYTPASMFRAVAPSFRSPGTCSHGSAGLVDGHSMKSPSLWAASSGVGAASDTVSSGSGTQLMPNAFARLSASFRCPAATLC